MSVVFIEILNMSLSAGCVALTVMLIRLIIRKAPKKYSYALWTVVFFRLVCPFTIQLPVSAVPIQPQTIPHDIVYSETPFIQSGLPIIDSAINDVIGRTLLPVNGANSINPIQIILEIGAYLWLAGVLAFMLYGIISYLRLKKRISTAIRVHNNIYETDLIKTPFVLGFIRPHIYIPAGLGGKELEYIITHEQTHLRRLDYLIKPFAFFVAAIHWFSPIVWISYALMAKDMELSADESVMKRSDADIRGDYSNSLLALSAKKRGLLSPLAFGETGVKTRVKNVLNYKKPAFWVSIAAVVVVVAVSLSLVVSKALTPLETGVKEENNLYGNETPSVSDGERGDYSSIIANIDAIIKKINDRQVVEDEYFSYLGNNTELVDMLRDHNELTAIYREFFLNRATRTMIGVFQLEPYFYLKAEDDLPDNLDIPADVLGMIERIAHYSLYRNCTQLFLDDPVLSPIIEKEAGGSAGRWPYFWHTEYLDDAPEVKEGLADYFDLEEDLIKQLEGYKNELKKGAAYTNYSTNQQSNEIDAIDGKAYFNLTKEKELEITAEKLVDCQLYTNSKQIKVTIPKGDYKGTFYLYDV